MPDRINIPAWDTVRCSKCGEYRPKGNGERRKWNGRQCPECVRQTKRENRWTARGRKYNAICKEGPECFIKAARAMPQVCDMCGSTEGIVPDHAIALISKGPHCGLNVVPLCGKCNSSKGGSIAFSDGTRIHPHFWSLEEYFERLTSELVIDLHSWQDERQASDRKEPPPQPIITRRGGKLRLPAHQDISPQNRFLLENPDQWNIKWPGSNRIYRVSKVAGRWSCNYHGCWSQRCIHITAVLKYLRANGYEPE